jgi:hypothetical protein
MVVYIQNENIRYRTSNDCEITRKAIKPTVYFSGRRFAPLVLFPFDQGPLVSDRNKAESEL